MLIPTLQNTRTITDLRERATQTINEVAKKGLIFVFYRSKPRAVLMDINEFITMQEIIEDCLDIKEAKILKSEPRGKGFTLEEIKKRYA